MNHPVEIIVLPGLFLTLAFVFWTAVSAWQRRQRLRIMADFNQRLLDRVTSLRDFSEFARTEEGARMLKGAYASTGDAGPAARILRATETGIVALALSFGLLFLGWYFEEARNPFVALGAIGLSLGVGFLASAVVSRRVAASLKGD